MVTSIRPALPDLLGSLDLPRVPRQERSRLKRDKILEAALAAFGDRGYEATSIEDIAARASVGVGTVYGYFRSKRQILLNLVGLHVDQILSLGLGDLDLSSPYAAIENVVRRAVAQDQAFQGMRRACAEVVPTDVELADYLERAHAIIRSQVAAAIERARAGGAVRPGLDSAATALAVVALIDQIGFVPEANSEAVVTAAVRMIYHAIFVDPPAQL